ncbi:MAG TPA: T9SS type A sorting domain-containing protein [Saprospiraceae bacterium]|nr:T9SS type A sorting domain-containing protein [Saprospiraceae bacterium]
MKELSLLLLLLLVVLKMHSQPWLKNLPANKQPSEYTFYDYQNAFESYMADHPIDIDRNEDGIEREGDGGWMQFKRWEYKMQSVIDKETGAFPKKTAQQVCNEYYKTHAHQRSGIASNWTSLGPDYSQSGYSGIGRINCIAFHPTEVGTYWVGAASGGLWVTHSTGGSWTCMTDQLGVLGVSDIIIPENYDSTHTIYIATGDRDLSINRSIGVLKSTDGGNTFDTTGLQFTIYDNVIINRLLIDPNNSDVLLAATSWGVYKTEDGGATWNNLLTSAEYIDMEYRPGDFNVLYGATKYGQIYYSEDGGNTWTQKFDDGAASRIELAVSPNQPNWVYALASGWDSGLYGVFKSEDSGHTYNQVFYRDTTTNLLGWESNGSGEGGQGWYDLCLAASPTNANVVLLGGVNTWRSMDGGITWKIVNHWWGDGVQAVHADKHALRYRNNGDLFETNDGGVYFSRNNGTKWSDKSNGIVISEMYRLGVSQTDRGDVITGLQDNGTKSLSGGDWDDVIGGDGMECWIDYTDANTQYGTLYFGYLFRTDDHWENSTEITPDSAGDGAWITPYVIDPVDPNILYGGFFDVWQTKDKGDTWSQVSHLNSTSLLQSIAIAPSNNQVMYGTDGYNIYQTTDLTNWKKIRYNLPTNIGSVESITVKHDDPFTIWIALSGYNNPGVYQFSGSDSTWINISTGLPPIPIRSIVDNKQSESELQLFAATESGVYIKKGNEDWAPYANGLPNVRVDEIELYYSDTPGESRLRAATYGRGLWESPVPTEPQGGIAITFAPACFEQSAVVQLADYYGDIQWQQSPDGITGWENVTGGSGANNPVYTTSPLNTTSYYRAELTQPEYAPTYSTVTEVPIIPFPHAAGEISGSDEVCEGDAGEVYVTPSIANATSYHWILPDGIQGSSNTNFITLDFNTPAGTYELQVSGKNGECEGLPSSMFVTVRANPLELVIDSIRQPSCDIATGSIYYSNLPNGTWTIVNLADSTTINGEGNQLAIEDLIPGNYVYGIYNEHGCYTESQQVASIEDQPVTPAAPVITVSEFVLHSDSPTGNQWYDDNGPIPGATGQEFTATQGGNYYVIVTMNGCASDSSNIITLFNESIGTVGQADIIRVYPNPFKDELTIEAIGINESVDFEIVDQLGEPVRKGTFVKRTVVKMDSYPAGVYWVKVSLGNETIILKNVKE